jgi:predicted metal-dependent HD superfamily phosphohydrolase
VRVAVELREIDGVPLRAWVSEILKDGEAHQNEKDTLAEEVNNFILQALEPLADRCGKRLFLRRVVLQTKDHFAKTGSAQT